MSAHGSSKARFAKGSPVSGTLSARLALSESWSLLGQAN